MIKTLKIREKKLENVKNVKEIGANLVYKCKFKPFFNWMKRLFTKAITFT